MAVEQAMLNVLDYIIAQGGEVADEPGRLLATIATATGVPYKAVSVAVLALEQIGFVQVERASHPDPGRANRVARIALT